MEIFFIFKKFHIREKKSHDNMQLWHEYIPHLVDSKHIQAKYDHKKE